MSQKAPDRLSCTGCQKPRPGVRPLWVPTLAHPASYPSLPLKPAFRGIRSGCLECLDPSRGSSPDFPTSKYAPIHAGMGSGMPDGFQVRCGSCFAMAVVLLRWWFRRLSHPPQPSQGHTSTRGPVDSCCSSTVKGSRSRTPPAPPPSGLHRTIAPCQCERITQGCARPDQVSAADLVNDLFELTICRAEAEEDHRISRWPSSLWAISHTTTFVREGGLEPPCPLGHTDLNRARLPISPLAQT